MSKDIHGYDIEVAYYDIIRGVEAYDIYTFIYGDHAKSDNVMYINSWVAFDRGGHASTSTEIFKIEDGVKVDRRSIKSPYKNYGVMTRFHLMLYQQSVNELEDNTPYKPRDSMLYEEFSSSLRGIEEELQTLYGIGKQKFYKRGVTND